MLYVVETYAGAKLIGEILTMQQAKKILGSSVQIGDMVFDGIWLSRKTHISFIANDEIKSKRPATIFDVEEEGKSF